MQKKLELVASIRAISAHKTGLSKPGSRITNPQWPSDGDLHAARRCRPKIHATRIETAYKINIGAANNSMLGTSFVGDKTAAAIRITITAMRQTRNIQPAVTRPMRDST